MHITTEAIVLRERTVDDYDSVLTLLTKDCGVITAYARGVRKPRAAIRVCAELLSYSCFVLFRNKDKYSVDKADIDTVFMGIRGDIEKLSLASYLCELTAEVAPHEEEAGEYLRLLLNSLHMLDQKKRSCAFIKPLYELRLLTMAGFMPNLVSCSLCGNFETDTMYFIPQTAEIVCSDCSGGISRYQASLPINKSVLAAMRHIIYADSAKLFSFLLGEAPTQALGEAVQQFVIAQTEKRFETLDFYLSMRV